MFKQHDGWVPFDDMYDEIKRGVTNAVINPTHTTDDMHKYISLRVEGLRTLYIAAKARDDTVLQQTTLWRFIELRDLSEYMGVILETLRTFKQSK